MPEGEDIHFVKVGDVFDLHVKGYLVVDKDAYISEAVKVLVENPQSRAVYVQDQDGKLVGIVPLRELLRIASARFGVRAAGIGSFFSNMSDVMKSHVDEIMKRPVSIKADETLKQALQVMEENDMTDLPVVDKAGKVVGELNATEVLRFMIEGMQKGDERHKALKSERTGKAKRNKG